MSSREYLMQFVMIFIGSMPFVAVGFFADYMARREERRRDESER